MNGSVKLRQYEEADLSAVVELCAAEGWTSYVEDPFRAHRVFTAPGVVSVAAVLEGEVVGFAYFQTDGAIQAHLSLLVVGEMSRNAGIARALLAYALPLLGAVRIDLITDSASDFYRKLPHQETLGFRLYPATE